MNALTPVGQRLDRLAAGVSRPIPPTDAFDLRALRCFAAAARHGNVGRAALDLQITASAVSQQIRKLEDGLGTPLLLRHGRGVTATLAGTRLLDRAEAILRLLDRPLAEDSESAAPEGAISIALPSELSGFLAAPLAARVRQAWPAVTLALVDSADGGAETWLLRGQVDVAILQDPSELAAWRIERVAAETLGVVAAPASAVGRNSLPVRLRDLTHVPLVLPNQRHWIRRKLAKAAFQRGVGLDVVFQADGVSIVKDMVRAGAVCSVLPAAAVREETARGSLVFRPLEQPALVTTHAVAIQSTATDTVRAVADLVAQAMRALAAGDGWAGSAPIEGSATAAAPGSLVWGLPEAASDSASVSPLPADGER